MSIIGLSKVQYELEQIAKNQAIFPHTLFKGPRGTGKTTLSKFVGQISKQNFREFNAPALDKQKMYQVLLSTRKGDMIFIDEIHRLSPQVEEILYQPMEGNRITLPFKNRVLTTDFPEFTLIGATTRPAMISKPLVSRFKVLIDIPMYSVRDMARMVEQRYKVGRRDALLIASHTAVPREALGLACRLQGLGGSVGKGLEFLGYREGLNDIERKYLRCLENGPLSLQGLSSSLQYERDSVEEVEDRLFYLGLIEIAARGRQLTALGMAKLGKIYDK